MNMNRVIKEYQGTQISVNEDGKFVATIGEREIHRTTIAAIEKEILKSVRPVKGFTLRYGERVETVMVAALETPAHGYRERFRTAERELRDGKVYHWDADLVARLERNRLELQAAVQRLNDEFEQLMKGAHQITKGSLEAERAQLKAETNPVPTSTED